MSHSTRPSAPSASQLAYLKALAQQTGTSFAYPRSRAQASAEIDRLRALKRSGNGYEHSEPDDSAAPYATAPQSDEISGYGSSARWRTSASGSPGSGCPPPSSGKVASSPPDPDANGALWRSGGRRPATRRLGRYQAREGARREVVAVVAADSSTLVMDCEAQSFRDARLVARLAPDEPPENAQLVTRLYLADESKGRCRALRREDLRPDGRETSAETYAPPMSAETLLRDGDGNVYSIRTLAVNGRLCELCWTRSRDGDGSDPYDVVTLRDVVGALQAYEPAQAITASAASRHSDDSDISTCRIRAELQRLKASKIVLNRGLREAVERKLSSGELTMSEIAIRCGRLKRDGRGNVTGETSWVARRIGQLPEGGQAAPAPWIHTDVLALIVRDGLGLNPNEVELG